MLNFHVACNIDITANSSMNIAIGHNQFSNYFIIVLAGKLVE